MTYREKDPLRYPKGPLLTLESDPENATLTAFGVINYTVMNYDHRVLLITPSVAQSVRSYFSCPSSPGILLEDFLQFSPMMHFERRQLNFELMTNAWENSATISAFTKSMLEDTGFYGINGSYVFDGNYSWGQSYGCDFLWGMCNTSTWPNNVFCTSESDIGYDLRWFGPCSLVVVDEVLPPPYQHFPSNPRLGGVDAFADYCPYIAPKAYCTLRTDTPQLLASPNGTNYLAGYGSRAVQSNFLPVSRRLLPDEGLVGVTPTCSGVVCLNGSLAAVRVGNRYFRCTGGETINLTFPPGFAVPSHAGQLVDWTFVGSVRCPNPFVLCESSGQEDVHVPDLKEASWPVLLDVQPSFGSIAGGDSITLWGLNFFNPMTCVAALVGGVLTSGYALVSTNPGANGFVVNLSYVDTSNPVLGGANADGTGTAIVELLCEYPGHLVCGPEYAGLCGVASFMNFTLTPAPPTPGAGPSFFQTNAGYAVVAIVSIVLLVTVMFVTQHCVCPEHARAVGDEQMLGSYGDDPSTMLKESCEEHLGLEEYGEDQYGEDQPALEKDGEIESDRLRDHEIL
jgi:hypothetical protein